MAIRVRTMSDSQVIKEVMKSSPDHLRWLASKSRASQLIIMDNIKAMSLYLHRSGPRGVLELLHNLDTYITRNGGSLWQ